MSSTMFSGGAGVTEPPDPEVVVEAYAAPEITTEAGRYLRAVARDEVPPRRSVADDDARRLWEIAFGLAARRRFAERAPLAEISRTVAAAVHEHPTLCLPMLDAEMLLRAALGEEVPVDEIDPDVVVAVYVLLFRAIADELALGEDELGGLIVQAEKTAF
ncbi:hypothetical protein HH310_04765 [Actinoplanes sp. TBRC 11911]|uniref:hypothetical protein n=1 Tax=Actinoplanes sp. TBRC 11911 TaxID=2729386 RepID=UPI00145E913B|nr:hypothetical protein [Actinoplanes sp. TBRC 11911]NMO50505.1 hypothetical protein [Actinoplanes sp. TBRC 11911]